ncbi:hypothetical protein JZ751_001336 [Albula glossodonta]|uniref:BAR domain-containing protein n=1 Tax=Albula glossodonta TaxID=121402 RepID=A0A8T2PTE5_9TELE|nr:hypothetical protein JZ751_001336 [Albula glossodonta]
MPLSPPLICHAAFQLWSEEVDKAEHELRVAQTEFDRQAEVTRLLLEGISSTHVNHLRCLHEFVEAQAIYYSQCHQYMMDLQKELGRYTNAFTVNPTPSPSSSPSTAATLPVAPIVGAVSAGTPETDTLKIEEVQPPATGTRKAKVLYDYDAADTSEMSLLADESKPQRNMSMGCAHHCDWLCKVYRQTERRSCLSGPNELRKTLGHLPFALRQVVLHPVLSVLSLITVYTVPGMDPDWLIGERGNQKGKVPVTYLELLS